VPYSCLAVAAPLVAEGYDVEIIDEFSTPNYERQLIDAATRADLAGISCFTGFQIESALRTARLLRKHFPQLPLVWGGYHPSLYPETTVASEFADFVITGQGEWTFLDLVNRFAAQEAVDSTPGVWRKVNGVPTRNPTASAPFRGLEDFPPFPFHLISLSSFLIDSLTPKSISYHSSLGCPFRCNFCAVTQIYEQRWSGFPAERVLRDVRRLVESTGAHSVEFYDNNFFVNDQRTFEIARALLTANLGIIWSGEARPDKIAEYDDDMMSLLTRSGLRWVFIGAESGHDTVLEMMDRDHNVSDILRAAERLSRHKIKATFSFNIGYPGEPPDNFKQTEALCRELLRINRETELMIYVTTAYDATPSFHRAREFASKTTSAIDDWSHLDQRSGAGKAWLSPEYSRKLFNFSITTFYATSFLHRRLRLQFPRNLFLRLLHGVAKVRLRFGSYRTILDLRILNKLFLLISSKPRRQPVEMWSGRS
jgi:anaerobic magnesium-protoporphyrin IX monomethyl ester cyclase